MDAQAKKAAITKAADVAGADHPTLLEKLQVEYEKYVDAGNAEMAQFLDDLIFKIKAEKKRLRRNESKRRKARKAQKAARRRNR